MNSKTQQKNADFSPFYFWPKQGKKIILVYEKEKKEFTRSKFSYHSDTLLLRNYSTQHHIGSYNPNQASTSKDDGNVFAKQHQTHT